MSRACIIVGGIVTLSWVRLPDRDRSTPSAVQYTGTTEDWRGCLVRVRVRQRGPDWNPEDRAWMLTGRASRINYEDDGQIVVDFETPGCRGAFDPGAGARVR